ncbi:hypothetical protein ACQKWADRAFT_286702 [Trichoderma austrokoningii]
MASIPFDWNNSCQMLDLLDSFVEWLFQPHVFRVVMAWVRTYTTVCQIMLGFRFGA